MFLLTRLFITTDLYLMTLTYNMLTPDNTRELPGKLALNIRLMSRLKDDIRVLFLANVSSLDDDSNYKGTTARGKNTVPVKFDVQCMRRINRSTGVLRDQQKGGRA